MVCMCEYTEGYQSNRTDTTLFRRSTKCSPATVLLTPIQFVCVRTESSAKSTRWSCMCEGSICMYCIFPLLSEGEKDYFVFVHLDRTFCIMIDVLKQ